MKNTKYSISLILFLAMFVMSCGNVLSEDDNGKTMELDINSVFKVKLEGTIQPGFEWKVVGINNSVFEQIGEPEIDQSDDTVKNYMFIFKTISAGNTILRMIYYDKNAEDPKPEKEFELRIISGTMGRIAR